nr:hypothetical protein GW17_00036002 [Ipomoea batatas]
MSCAAMWVEAWGHIPSCVLYRTGSYELTSEEMYRFDKSVSITSQIWTMHIVRMVVELAFLRIECTTSFGEPQEKVDEEFVVVWLSCDSFSNALNLARSSLDFPGPTAGACTGIWPLSIFTTETMDGLRVGDGLAHKRANLSIFRASSLE